MFTLTIPTAGDPSFGGDVAGPELARRLRRVAEHVTRRIYVVPSGDGQWVDEAYDMPSINARYTLTERVETPLIRAASRVVASLTGESTVTFGVDALGADVALVLNGGLVVVVDGDGRTSQSALGAWSPRAV